MDIVLRIVSSRRAAYARKPEKSRWRKHRIAIARLPLLELPSHWSVQVYAVRDRLGNAVDRSERMVASKNFPSISTALFQTSRPRGRNHTMRGDFGPWPTGRSNPFESGSDCDV